ncbi:MAG: cadherin-like beta sandwich domain-containing protein [Bacilli bacterium]|nr:cadherin-like beta sandwich domain-containing protein [Bacilli bacterium]
MKRQIKAMGKMGKILLILMFLFSQLSFPIEVLADELSQDEETTMETENKDESQNIESEEKEETTTPEENKVSEEVNENVSDYSVSNQQETNSANQVTEPETKKVMISINNEELENNEYILRSNDENKTLEISYGYSDDLQKDTVDFSNKLYGDYYFNYTLENNEEVKFTIHYNGNNDEILKKYLSSNLRIEDGKIIVYGKKEGIKPEDFLKEFNWNELKTDYEVTDYSLNSQEELIKTGDILSIKVSANQNATATVNYSIQLLGDYNNDGLVDEKDSEYIIDAILNNNTEQNFNIIDATNPVFKTGLWENNATAKDELENSLVTKKETYVGEELVVKYYLNGFKEDKLTGIEGTINYNKDLLELMNVETNATFGGMNENNHFAYLLDDYSSENAFMTLTFKVLKKGEANISIDDIKASNGVEVNLNDNISTIVKISEYGKGGDVEENQNSVTTTQNTDSTPSVQLVNLVATPTTTVTAKTIKLSSDNLIKTLKIKGYTIDFDPNKLEYSIKVKNNTKSLDLEIVLSDENASYEVSGNQNFKVGENLVTIKVTAEDGSERTYTLKVTKEKAKDTEEKEEKSSSKTIIIILIILVIIGLIYVIFKDDEEDNKESKK